MAEDEAKKRVSQVKQFYLSVLSDHIKQTDPTLSLFKTTELDSTVNLAESGSYHSYWTVDKIAELNNLVDTKPNCPENISNIFKQSRNTRLRGNRIGNAIINRIGELLDQGGGSSAPLEPTPVTTTETTAPAENVTHNHSLLEGLSLIRYVFSSDLPANCQLRMRDQPSMDGGEVMVVTSQDEILGHPSVVSGDWLRAKVGSVEAWMLTDMGGQQLLVAENSQPTSQPPPASVPEPFVSSGISNTTMRPQSSPSKSVSHRTVQPETLTVHESFNPMIARPEQYSPARDIGMGMGTLNTTMNRFNLGNGATNLSMAPDATLEGQPVPYELYRRLEIRVNRLEAELNNLKMCLRSV
eukprot:m.8559 g.8559  ORF g.8559 m.8559 type:complete len:354 (+) comp3922_c0_seq1:87-1148(+)